MGDTRRNRNDKASEQSISRDPHLHTKLGGLIDGGETQQQGETDRVDN